MQGTKVGFATRVPTDGELRTCQHVDMTSKQEWDPKTVHLQEVSTEGDLTKEHVELEDDSYAYMDPTSDYALLHSMDPTTVNLREIQRQCTYKKFLRKVI
eukprot:scaffold13132_cov59-Cylindrotheca_fusiformis.AAC.1